MYFKFNFTLPNFCLYGNLTFLFQVKDLILDNTHATQIEGLTDEYTALESLSLINVGLISLKGFPKLPNLQKVRWYFIM